MAQQTDANDASTDEQTVTVQVYYSAGAHTKGVEPPAKETERYEMGRDLRAFGAKAFGQRDYSPKYAIETGMDKIDEGSITVGDTDPDCVAKEVYTRMQGPRQDDELDYVGSERRSMMVGDIIVVDGTAIMVAAIGFEELDVDL